MKSDFEVSTSQTEPISRRAVGSGASPVGRPDRYAHASRTRDREKAVIRIRA